MIPLAVADLPDADEAIHASDRGASDQRPATRLRGAEPGREVGSQAHEDVTCAVDDHQALDQLLVGGGRR